LRVHFIGGKGGVWIINISLTQYEDATKAYMKSILMLLGADDDPDSGLDNAINQIYAIEKDLAEVRIFVIPSCVNVFLLHLDIFAFY